MTPPATDRGLSEADRALIEGIKTGFDGPNGYGWWQFHEVALARLLAAARREGEGGDAVLSALKEMHGAVGYLLTAGGVDHHLDSDELSDLQGKFNAAELVLARASGAILYQDGLKNDGRPMWCAVMPGFVNLQESPAGFDGEPLKAVQNLHAAIKAAALDRGAGR